MNAIIGDDVLIVLVLFVAALCLVVRLETARISINYNGPGMYQHYKGGLYIVFGTVLHTETREMMVLYGQVQDDSTQDHPQYVGPLRMFNQLVRRQPRFRRVADGHV